MAITGFLPMRSTARPQTGEAGVDKGDQIHAQIGHVQLGDEIERDELAHEADGEGQCRDETGEEEKLTVAQRLDEHAKRMCVGLWSGG